MNTNKKLKFATALGSLCLGLLNSQTSSAADTTLALEEVVVTATKRGDTNPQDIPMSISVASSDMIAKQGLVGMDDFLRATPATNFLDRGAWS